MKNLILALALLLNIVACSQIPAIGGFLPPKPTAVVNFPGWEVNAAITTGISVPSTVWNKPEAFWLDGNLYLLIGRNDGNWSGFVWNGSSWQSSALIINGLNDIGSYSCPTTFQIGADFYMISGSNLAGTYFGFKWNGTGWSSNSAIISGLTNTGGFPWPDAFYINNTLYLITTAGPSGFEWNGSSWQSSSLIVTNYSALAGAQAYEEANVFQYGSSIYGISGGNDGMHYGMKWNGTGWIDDTLIDSGLTDVGSASSPTTFQLNGFYYTITGTNNSTFIGYKSK